MRTALIIIILACLLAPALARAQSELPRLPRNDVSASIGWFGGEYPLEPYNRWHASLLAGVSGGHYWTDHLKTEVEAAWPSLVRTQSYENITIGGDATYAIAQYQFRDTRLSIGQVYQFGRNAWVHPFVGAGVEVSRLDSRVDRVQQMGATYHSDRTTTLMQIPPRHERSITVRAQPFMRTGLKMYVSDRGFFTTELKLGLGSGIDQAIWKTGIGFDF